MAVHPAKENPAVGFLVLVRLDLLYASSAEVVHHVNAYQVNTMTSSAEYEQPVSV